MNLFSDKKRIQNLEYEVRLLNCKFEQLNTKIIGEVYSFQVWLQFTKNELVDKIGNHFKIGIEGEFSPQWFDKQDVIIYDTINPLNKTIEQIKAKKENQIKKEN